ncbi:MAG: hypothetical protein ACK419_06325, partial [Pyrinomonadaceae bacterium]
MRDAIRNYSLPSIGAGDLVDRAFRLYRQHFSTFFFIAFPPVIVGTLFSASWWLVFNILFYVERESISANLLILTGNLVFWFIEIMLVLCVMGGATRNFITHILFGTPFSFRETYSNTISRLSSLLAASFLILLSAVPLAVLTFSILPFLVGMSWIFIFSIFGPGYVSSFLSIVFFLLAVFFLFKLFFGVVSRFAYVPQ